MLVFQNFSILYQDTKSSNLQFIQIISFQHQSSTQIKGLLSTQELNLNNSSPVFKKFKDNFVLKLTILTSKPDDDVSKPECLYP